MSRFLLWTAALVSLRFVGCRRVHPQESLASIPAPEGGPMLLAIYQPWFGNGQHIDVGYSSHDPAVISAQIARNGAASA